MLAALLWLIAPAPAASAGEAEPAAVRIGYYKNAIFQKGAKPGAARSGYAYEYCLKIAEYAGWKYEYVYGSFGELYDRLLKGEIDLLAGLARTENRTGRIGYPEHPMGEMPYLLMKRQGDSRISADPASLSGMSIGAVDGAPAAELEAWLARHGAMARIRRFSSPAELYQAFGRSGTEENRLDAFVAMDGGALMRNRAEAVLAFGLADYYLCTAASRPDLLAELNAAQAHLQAEEPLWLGALRMKHYPGTLADASPSAGEKAWLASHRSLRVGCMADYLPYSDADAKGQAAGMVRDLVAGMLKKLGADSLETSFKVYPSYREMTDALAKGEIDVAFPVAGEPYWAETSGLRQSNPVLTPSTALVYRSDDAGMKPRTIAVNAANDMQVRYVEANFPNAGLLVQLPSIEACLSAVLFGQADATVLDGLRGGEILSNAKFAILSARPLPHANPRRFGVRMSDEGLLRLINRGLALAGEEWIQSLAVKHAAGLRSWTLADIAKACAAALATLAVLLFALSARRSKLEAARKEEARQKLEEKNWELATSRKKLTKALAEAKRASRAKTDFLNSISHDVRTPMNAIAGFAAMAESHQDSPEKVRDCLFKIGISSRHLLSLLNNVLDMSRIESGKAKLEKAEVNLSELLRGVRAIVNDGAQSKGVFLSVDADIVHERVCADRLRISQILLNLLSNAVKFTPEGGRIRFSIAELPSSSPGMADFRFAVKDSGIGMSPEFTKTVFDAFTRERTSAVASTQGTGLGMAISKRLAEMMGGTIAVESREGEGSEFTVVLPLKTIGPAPEPSAATQGRAAAAAGGKGFLRSVQPAMRRLGMEGRFASGAADAVQAVAEAKGNRPALFIADWDAPLMDGAEAVRAVRASSGGDAVFIAACSWNEAGDEARATGADCFMLKPCIAAALLRVAEGRFEARHRPGSATGAAGQFAGARILLAEDNEFNREIAVDLLGDAGFEVDVAENGAEALAKVETAPAGWYAIVLMDIQMPAMDGYEAARRIRALSDPAKAGVPIVAVTANAFEEDRKTALEAGMDGHLPKPYDVPKMTAMIADLLERGPRRSAS
ncbi:MAG: response regulator [Desulfovibrio sp.]|nr:response regulator [Desulfovibrio sp.]